MYANNPIPRSSVSPPSAVKRYRAPLQYFLCRAFTCSQPPRYFFLFCQAENVLVSTHVLDFLRSRGFVSLGTPEYHSFVPLHCFDFSSETVATVRDHLVQICLRALQGRKAVVPNDSIIVDDFRGLLPEQRQKWLQFVKIISTFFKTVQDGDSDVSLFSMGLVGLLWMTVCASPPFVMAP